MDFCCGADGRNSRQKTDDPHHWTRIAQQRSHHSKGHLHPALDRTQEGRSERAGRINGPTGDVKSRRRYVTRAQRLHGSLRMWNGSVIQFVSKKNSNHRSGRRGLYTLHLCRGPRQTRNVYSLARSGCARFLIQICRTHLYKSNLIILIYIIILRLRYRSL
jgi:hypothetical protein